MTSKVKLLFGLSADCDFLEMGLLGGTERPERAKWVRIHRGVCCQLLLATAQRLSATVPEPCNGENALACLTDEQLQARGALSRVPRPLPRASEPAAATITDFDVTDGAGGLQITFYGAKGIALRLPLSRVNAQGLLLVVEEASRAGGWNLPVPAWVDGGRRVAAVAAHAIGRARQGARSF